MPYESSDMSHQIWVIVWWSKIDHRLNYSNQFRLQLLALYLFVSFQFAPISTRGYFPNFRSALSQQGCPDQPEISTGSDWNSVANIFSSVRTIVYRFLVYIYKRKTKVGCVFCKLNNLKLNWLLRSQTRTSLIQKQQFLIHLVAIFYLVEIIAVQSIVHHLFQRFFLYLAKVKALLIPLKYKYNLYYIS